MNEGINEGYKNNKKRLYGVERKYDERRKTNDKRRIVGGTNK